VGIPIPSGRCLPSGLGMDTRRTGCGGYVFLLRSSASSSSHFSTPEASMSATVWPSIPGAPPWDRQRSKANPRTSRRYTWSYSRKKRSPGDPFALACHVSWSFRTVSGGARLTPISWFSCPFGRRSGTQAPSLHRRSPASSVLRACPPPRPARPVPRGRPVGGHAPPLRGASRVAGVSRVSTCRCHYPGGIVGSDRSWDGLFHPFRFSPATAAFPE